jgi:hypothetical protein
VWQLRAAVVTINDTMVRIRHKSGQVVDVHSDAHRIYGTHKQSDWRQLLSLRTRVMIGLQAIKKGVYHACFVRIACESRG